VSYTPRFGTLLLMAGVRSRGEWGKALALPPGQSETERRERQRWASRPRGAGPCDLQHTFRLLLATVWLTDAALQLQPFMFTKGPDGFSGMLHGMASGNPSWISHSISWNASIVYHQPVLTNALFAATQFLIALGIAWPRTCRPALALSIAWALGVWWFGEGLGGLFTGAATPLGGGPGAVLFYAVLAVLLWPSRGSNAPFVAARTVGAVAARAVWTAVWLFLALLAVVGSGRSPQALHGIVAKVSAGQPGWLLHIDRWSESLLARHGTTVAVLFAVFCGLVAFGVYLHSKVTKVVMVSAIAAFVVIWVAVQNFGGELAGGATDPSSGLLVLLFIATYWPHAAASQPAATQPAMMTTTPAPQAATDGADAAHDFSTRQR
jgi:hypothetical protein